MKPLLVLLAILSLSATGFAQQILWQRAYPYTSGATGRPEDICISRSGNILTLHALGPLFLTDSSGETAGTRWLLKFSSAGDSLRFEVQSPGIIEGHYQIKELSNHNIVTWGYRYPTPFHFSNPPNSSIPYIRIMDSTATQIKRDYVFNNASLRVTLGAVGGILPAKDGGFWMYGSRDDSAFAYNFKPYLMRFDSSGNIVYDIVYPDSGTSQISSLMEDTNGNLVAFGYRQIRTGNIRRGKCVQYIFSPNGNLIRRRHFDLDTRANATYSVDGATYAYVYGAPHPSGGYILYGDITKSGLRDTTSFITLIDSSLSRTSWLRQIRENHKVRVLKDGSVFLINIGSYLPSSRWALSLRRFDSTGALFQNIVLNTATGNWNGTPYTFHSSNYEFAGDSSVILIGSTSEPPPSRNALPLVYIAKIGGFPNPYTILSLPVDQPLVRALVVYPNPFQDQLTISGNGQPGRLLLFDRLGKQVYEGAYTAGEPVSLQGLPSGFYFYRFHGHSGGKHWSYGGKVIKQ